MEVHPLPARGRTGLLRRGQLMLAWPWLDSPTDEALRGPRAPVSRPPTRSGRRAGCGVPPASSSTPPSSGSTGSGRSTAGSLAVEEELLLPVISDADPEWRAAAQRVRDEHRAIRGRLPGIRAGTAIESASPPLASSACSCTTTFASRSASLFGLLEDRLEADALVALGHAITESGRGHDVVSSDRRPEGSSADDGSPAHDRPHHRVLTASRAGAWRGISSPSCGSRKRPCGGGV